MFFRSQGKRGNDYKSIPPFLIVSQTHPAPFSYAKSAWPAFAQHLVKNEWSSECISAYWVSNVQTHTVTQWIAFDPRSALRVTQTQKMQANTSAGTSLLDGGQIQTHHITAGWSSLQRMLSQRGLPRKGLCFITQDHTVSCWAYKGSWGKLEW